ncbi:MAG TPA: DUF6438 domain-containing protein [Polyangiaceae bacterium]|nr:DUF6438 domain-containing protein [Polyangiaceae bacterium]
MQHGAARRIPLALLFSWVAGCAGSTSSGTESIPIDSDTLVTLARSACFGNCPVYSLTIAGDGSVTYRGEAFVRVMGPASGNVPVEDVQALVDRMLRANYFNLSVPMACKEGIATDASGATPSLTHGGRTHEVQDYHGNACAPAVLGEIENAIDALVDSEQWTRCDTENGACCDPVHGNILLFPCN